MGFTKLQATAAVFFLTLAFILREYFFGGVISHNLLAREDLPAISNWWGLLSLPLLFWLGISLIERRQNKRPEPKKQKNKILRRLLGGLAFGILISSFWEFGLVNYLPYLILLPLLFALFIPVHLPEYIMGFAVGMVFTFGGVLPLLIGGVLLALSFVINSLVRILRNLIFPKKQ